MAMLWASCKRTKYVCAAYTSAFVLDMPTYKRNAALDSMAIAADTSLDIDVIAVLAERIKKDPLPKYAYTEDSVPQFPASGVIKTNVLLIKKISRRRKDKMMAQVPMITVFPKSPEDSTKLNDGLNPEPGPDTAPADAPAEGSDAPAQKDGDKKDDQGSNPFRR